MPSHSLTHTSDFVSIVDNPISTKVYQIANSSLRRMNKTSNYCFRIPLVVFSLLLMLFSTFHFQVQLGNAQNNSNSVIGPLSTLRPEQVQQLAANGTSFDAAMKQRIAAMNAAKIPVNYTSLGPSKLLKGINLCTSPLGKAFAQTICDFTIAMVYELCQAIPDKLSYICIMPSINSYMKDRNMVDGQTDKLVWQFLLHSKEITANPYGNGNSTGISNSTTIN